MKKTFTSFVFLICTIFVSITTLNAQTYFTDDFENGLGKWIAGGNNWDTLSTTYTSSNHCITDSRIGNYTHNSDPTITMSGTINLTSSTFPVLTLFHRYNLFYINSNYRDFIYLEISTNGGFNWTTIRSWESTNWAWTFVQIDLRNYRTNLVKFRFMLSSHNSWPGTADGWYIDDIVIVENNTLNPTNNLPFIDNFENGMGKWIKGGFNWDTTSSTHNSSNHCATDSRLGNYTNASAPMMTMSGVIDLSNTTTPVLTFFHRYNLFYVNNNYRDFIYIEISTNGGFNFRPIDSLQGTNLAWTLSPQYNLTNYRTNMVKIRFLMWCYNSWPGTADGWYIDDISIRDLATGVTQLENSIPNNFSLKQNFPNPFNPSTNIEFSVPKQSNVKINVYDSQGKEVAALLNEILTAGTYRLDFDGTGYSSGVYFYKMETENFVQTKRMLLVK